MPLEVREKFRALIVDDDPVSRAFLVEYLKDVAECVTAETGEAGVTEFRAAEGEQRFTLVCLDTYLPDFSGREVLRQIRAFEKEQALPAQFEASVLMITAAAEIRDVLKAMNRGCDGYIKKPFTKEQLFNELNKLGFELVWEE